MWIDTKITLKSSEVDKLHTNYAFRKAKSVTNQEAATWRVELEAFQVKVKALTVGTIAQVEVEKVAKEEFKGQVMLTKRGGWL